MTGLRSKLKCIGFYASPTKYKSHPGLYVMSRQGVKKVAAFLSTEDYELFLDVLEELFEDSRADWSMIGPCGNWSNEMKVRNENG